jgi:hypothetical protein
MSESPSSTLRNTRKHFVKCVDCRTQTLPQNAANWTAAALLVIGGRVNDGALCFRCANQRRKALGLVVEQSEATESNVAPASAMKHVTINRRHYVWEIDNLETLMTKWRAEYPNPTFKGMGLDRLVVAINEELVRTKDFSSVPISDGDTIMIMVGGVAGG